MMFLQIIAVIFTLLAFSVKNVFVFYFVPYTKYNIENMRKRSYFSIYNMNLSQ